MRRHYVLCRSDDLPLRAKHLSLGGPIIIRPNPSSAFYSGFT